MSKCEHKEHKLIPKLTVVQMPQLKANQPIVRLTMICSGCQRPFTFRAHHGFSTSEPTLSNDGLELRIPFDPPDDEAEPVTH